MTHPKFKIAHILHSVGGVDVSLRLILGSLDTSRFDNLVIHGYNDTKDAFVNKNNEVVTSYQTSIQRNISLYKDFKSLFFILKTLKKEKPHLIHCHSAKGGILGKLASFLTGIPCYHTPQAYSYLSAEFNLKRKIYLSIEKILSKLDNKILASSYSEKNRAIHDVGYKPEKVKVFSNSILPIDEIQELSISKTWPEKYICSVGRPSYQKNIELMVLVLNELKKKQPNIHLVLMGVGFHSPNLNTVKELIERHQLNNNITLLEWTRRKDIFHIVANSQLYISTARYEGLPYSIIESLALSKACVVSDADGNRDLIEDGKNGYIIASQEPNKFSEKIISLLENENLLKTFEAFSKLKFENEFNMNSTIKNLELLYIKEARIY